MRVSLETEPCTGSAPLGSSNSYVVNVVALLP